MIFLGAGALGCATLAHDQAQAPNTTYLFRRGHLLDLLVEDRLNPLTHVGDGMVWTVESNAIAKDEAYILHKLLSGVVARVGGVGVRLRGVRGAELALDGGEVHWTLDDLGVMGDAQRDRIDGIQEGTCVLHLLQRTNGG